MQTFVRRGLAALLVCLAAARADAAPIVNHVGLVAPAVTITFSEHVLPANTAVIDQYADLGFTFEPGLFYDVQPLFFPTPSLANFDDEFTVVNDPVTIHFADLVTGAAVAVQTNPGSTTFTALLNGVVVESFTAATTLSELPDLTNASNFYGFSGITFDALRIDPELVFQIDNLQFDPAPVPEPTSLLLLGSGLVGVAVTIRRRLARRG